MTAARRLRKLLARTLLGLVVVVVVGYLSVQLTGNLGTIRPGRAYRSAQLSGAALSRTIQRLGIRTVINLRGSNPDADWYRAERTATTTTGAVQVDIAMSSCQWMSRAQLRTIIQAIDESEYPLLIHCQHGSERTGLVAAILTLLQPGSTLEEAKRQFTIRHLFLPIRDGKIMAAHLAQYETWLHAGGSTHSPESFRRWVEEGFTPHLPSREQWPYDPYPLVVETVPAEAGPSVTADLTRPVRR